MCCQFWWRHLGNDGFLGRLVEHGSSCDFLVFPDLLFPSFQCWYQVLDVSYFCWSQGSQRRANLVHLRFWIEPVFQLSPCFETVVSASFDDGSRFSSGVYKDVNMQCFVAHCLHDVCACYGCCVNRVVSENRSDVVAPVVIDIASDLLDPDLFSLLLLLLLCCRSPAHCVSCCTCAVDAAKFPCSVMLRERCVVAAACVLRLLLRPGRSFKDDAPLPCTW